MSISRTGERKNKLEELAKLKHEALKVLTTRLRGTWQNTCSNQRNAETASKEICMRQVTHCAYRSTSSKWNKGEYKLGKALDGICA